MSSLNISSYDQYRWQFRRYYDWFLSGKMYSYMSDIKGEHNNEVDFERVELQEVMIKYITIRDCLLGEANVKDRGEVYLPRPSDEETNEENIRYEKYIRRATFLNATGLTQRTIIGKLFNKPPTIELPSRLEMLKKNVNGEGLSFAQLIEQALAETFAFGRCGLYADFDVGSDTESVSIAESEGMLPTIMLVKAENIINWRIDKTRKKVIMVVVREFYEVYDKFSVRLLPQYRVFSLDKNDVLTVQLYRAKEKNEYYNYGTGTRRNVLDLQESKYTVVESHKPKLPNGEYWDIIPFAIIGSIDNDWTIDDPPLYQIATYDIALYRNSADIEEAAFYVGQPTPYVAGIDREWIDDMELNEMRWGSGKFIPLEHADSKLGLIQASPETMLDTLIDHKMSILRHLGATVFSTEKLAEDQTATGAIYQALQVHAPLVTTSRNVVEAFEKVLGFAAMFMGIDPDSEQLEVKLNSDILDNPLGITGLQMALQLWKDGAITWEELREQLRVQGIAQHSAEEAKKMIEENPSPKPMMPAPLMRAQNDNTANQPQQNEAKEMQDNEDE